MCQESGLVRENVLVFERLTDLYKKTDESRRVSEERRSQLSFSKFLQLLGILELAGEAAPQKARLVALGMARCWCCGSGSCWQQTSCCEAPAH